MASRERRLPRACRLCGSDQHSSGGGAGVGRSDIQLQFQIQMCQLVVPDLAIVLKTTDLSFSFDKLNRAADLKFVRDTQQSNSGLDLRARFKSIS